MRKSYAVTARCLLLIVAFAGCASMGATPSSPGIKSFVDMNPKEKSLYFMGWYKAQYEDASAMGALALQGKLSPGQLEVYRTKRQILIKAKPLIEVYDAVAAGGGVPGAGKDQEIFDLINALAALGGGA